MKKETGRGKLYSVCLTKSLHIYGQNTAIECQRHTVHFRWWSKRWFTCSYSGTSRAECAGQKLTESLVNYTWWIESRTYDHYLTTAIVIWFSQNYPRSFVRLYRNGVYSVHVLLPHRTSSFCQNVLWKLHYFYCLKLFPRMARPHATLLHFAGIHALSFYCRRVEQK